MIDNENNKRKNIAIDADGSHGTIINNNEISAYEVGISGRNSKDLKVSENVISSMSNDELKFITEDFQKELKNISKVLEEIEKNGKNIKFDKLPEILTPVSIKLIDVYLKMHGYIE